MADKKTSFRLKPGFILSLLVLLALALRLLAALGRPMIQLDETAYVRMAGNLLSGHGLLEISGLSSIHFSPLLPLLIAAAASLTHNHVLSAYITVALFGSLLLIPAYLLGRELASEKVGLMAAALMAVMPLFVDYSSRIYGESVYIFFLLFAIFFGYRVLLMRRWPAAALAGGSLGLAYLANPSAIFYLVALLALAVGVAAGTGAYRQMARAAAIMLVVFGILATPYLIYLHGELGQWAYSGKAAGTAGNIYAATHNLRHGTLEWERDLMSLTPGRQELKIMTLDDAGDPAGQFFSHPGLSARIFADQAYIFYSQELPRVFPLWLLPLLGLGLFAGAWSRRRALEVGYLLLMMAPALLILTMYAHSRFFMPFVPLAMIWVAEGWRRLADWGRQTVDLNWGKAGSATWQRLVPWVLGTAIMLPLLVFSGVTVLKQSYPVEYREAGALIKRQAGAGQRILSREYSSAYYAEGTVVMLPYASYEDTTAYAKDRNIGFLVIGRGVIRDWRPGLARLLEDSSAHPEWKLIGEAPGADGETALVFQLNENGF